MSPVTFQAQNPHISGDPFGWYACGPFSLAMGLEFATGGAIASTGHIVRERTNDSQPRDGTNLDQLATAAASFGVGLEVRRRMDFDDLLGRLEGGHAVVVGLSYGPLRDRPESGDRKFTGNHYLLVLPGLRVYDPLCDGRRADIFKGPYTIGEGLLATAAAQMVVDLQGHTVGAGRAYAGVLPRPQPPAGGGVPAPPPDGGPVDGAAVVARPVTFRHGGGPHARGDYVSAVDVANIRADPHVTHGGLPAHNVVGHLLRGQSFHCSQTTDIGQPVGGSRRWFGDRTGGRWVHSSVVVAHP
jgi:hypothetical protein